MLYVCIYTHVTKQLWTKESCFCPQAMEPASPFYLPRYVQVFEVQMLTWAETERPHTAVGHGFNGTPTNNW